MIDFGNVVNTRKPTIEERFYHRNPHKTIAELVYDARGHQLAQLIHVIGEAVQARQGQLAASLCDEAISTLVGLREVCNQGKFI